MPGMGVGSGGVLCVLVQSKNARRMRMRWQRDCLQLNTRPASPLLFEHVLEGAWSGWWVQGMGWLGTAGKGADVACCHVCDPIAGCSDFTLRPQQAGRSPRRVP